MTIALKLRRGTTAENDAFTGQEGELSYDTEAKQLRVHDGATPGGTKVAKDAVMTGATASAAGTAGLVPAPAAGKQDQFLRGDGSWGAISASAGGVPSGTIIAYAGRTVPSGYLICNGAAVSRTTYANLFAAIGTIYGAGDGSTTFNLPNLAGRFLEGTTDSSSVGTYVEAGLPDITGSIVSNNKREHAFLGDSFDLVSDAFSITGVGSKAGIPSDTGISNWGCLALYFEASKSNSVYGKSDAVRPNSAYVLMIIKT